MDADRFDTLARTLTSARSRRSALGSVVAGGVLSTFGLGRGEPQHVAAQGECGDNGELCALAGQGGLCVVDFEATVQQGPSAGQALVRGGAAGTLRGYLRFSLSGSGNLQNADLLLSDGSSLPVVGQVTGHSFQVRVDFGQDRAVVAVGIGEQPVARCLGRIDGTAVGPGIGDLGEFHALAGVQNIPPSNGSGNGNGPPPPGGSGNTSQAGQGGQGQPGQTGSRTRNDGPSGVQGPPSGSGTGSVQGSSSGSGSTSAAQPLATGAGEAGNGPRSGQPNGPQGASGATGPSGPAGRAGSTGVSGVTSASQSLPDQASSGSNGADTAEARQGDDDGDSEGGQATDLDVVQAESEQVCAPGETRCLDACVDTQRDPLNCGTCGNACINDSTCVAGACTPAPTTTTCPTGQTRCGEICVDTTSSATNCSACGRACATDEVCRDSLCVPATGGGGCKTGLTACGTTCSNLQTDKANCGACGVVCATGEGCLNGVCTAGSGSCPTGQVLCGTECRNALPLADGSVVCSGGGAPPSECPPGQALCNGACAAEGSCAQPADCPPGQGRCYGYCKDFQTDPGYCGSCSNPCVGGICSGGTCVFCPEGQTPCGSICANTATDLNNCGFCGNFCGTQCINGQCTGVGPAPSATCPDGLTRCGDFCVDLALNVANCGACGVVCPAPTRCTASYNGNPPGICYMPREVCTAQGLYPCGTRCVDYDNDPNNCGACFEVCGTGYECRNGLCYVAGASQTLAPNGDEPAVETALEPEPAAETEVTEPEPATEAPVAACPDGQFDCGGYCADLASDPYNCGGCNVVCGVDSSCDAGSCSAPVAPPDVVEDTPEEPVNEDAEPACTDAGGFCDPASPGSCCSGTCNEDGSCA